MKELLLIYLLANNLDSTKKNTIHSLRVFIFLE